MKRRHFLAAAIRAAIAAGWPLAAAAMHGIAHGETPKARPELLEQYRRPGAIPFPASNPFSTAKAKLGQTLFFDPRLSGSNRISCATCHNPLLGWGDGLPKGRGEDMRELPRRTPTILNLAWSKLLFWDGRAKSLEEQALVPIAMDIEMHQDLNVLAGKLGAIPGYAQQFDLVFPGEGVSSETVAKALATYERAIVSGTAPFDRWVSGDESAIPEAAKRGFALFNGKANCASCHVGWAFTNNGFADIGLPDTAIGRGAYLKQIPAMQHAFKTPTLRDVALRAPYMHDGSIPALEGVIAHYSGGFVERPSLSANLKPLGLTAEESADLVAFLETLTEVRTPVVLPTLPANPH
jgi:cytochrome c peroxidase